MTVAAFADPRDFGAVGDNSTDDTSAFVDTMAFANTEGIAMRVSRGCYKITAELEPPRNLHIISHCYGAIRFASTERNLFRLTSGVDGFTLDGLEIIGDPNDVYSENFGASVYQDASNADVTMKGCIFGYNTPLFTAQTQTQTEGRLDFSGNRILNSPLPISLPYYANIVRNWFINDEIVDTRSHAIYVFGESQRVNVALNFFKNIYGNAVKFRATATNFRQKRNLTVVDNFIENNATYGVWIGADSDSLPGTMLVQGNTFRNCASPILSLATSNVDIKDNMLEWDFETQLWGGSAGIFVGGSPANTTVVGPSKNVKISGNTIVHRHPFVGTITFTAKPVEGDTVKIGAITYTWVDHIPDTPGQIFINSDAAGCTRELRNELRGGHQFLTINPVLRDAGDTFDQGTILKVVSDATFTMSATGTALELSAVVDMRQACLAPIQVLASILPEVSNNHCESFVNDLTLVSCREPTVIDNTLINTQIGALGNVFSRYRNKITYLRPINGEVWRGNKRIKCADAFPVMEDNSLVIAQDGTQPDIGNAGVAAVGDGHAKCYLFYGTEQATMEPSTGGAVLFKWSDGDWVQLTDENGTPRWATFKRDTPGTDEFNSGDSLIAWINSLGTFTASWAPYSKISGPIPDPKQMIEIKRSATAVDGDECFLDLSTKSLINGVTLNSFNDYDNPYAYKRAYFYGASADQSETVVFTRDASTLAPMVVSPMNPEAEDLTPVVYQQNVVPGVCYRITHGSALTGEEQFYFLVRTP